jgi:nucleotide-binding universal stress UspA family protein
MTVALLALVVVLAVAVVVLAVPALRPAGLRQRRSSPPAAVGSGRILFPFGAPGPTSRALDVALRLARNESGTLVPVFLARVALDLPLDAPLPRQSRIAIPLQEAVEQRAASFEVPVDARIERGRSYRHALRQMIDHESYDRLVVAAWAKGGGGFDPEDIAWLLRNAPGEIIVLRPSGN